MTHPPTGAPARPNAPQRTTGRPGAPSRGRPPAPAPPRPAPVPGAVAASGRPRGLRHQLGRTPGKLALLGVVAVIAALACGGLGYLGGSAQAGALDQARAHTTQLADAQSVRNTLVAADATATNAFLVGGLEPADQRAAYDDAIHDAALGLTRLAAANPDDAAIVEKANAGLPRYTGLVEQARATNRQGFPVGSAYLDQASTLMRDDIATDLQVVVRDNADRAASDFAAADHAGGYLAGGLLVLAVLVAGQIWLARRTHRVLNAGLAGATVLILVAGGVGAVVLSRGASTATDVRSGSYAGTLALSQAYALANDAKSMESFTLIKRGSGQAYEEEFITATTDASDRLYAAMDEGTTSRDALDLLNDWIDQHARIRALDDGGDWDGAVALAIDQGEGTPAAAFRAFEQQVQSQTAELTTATQTDLSSAARTARIAGWAMALAGLVGAVLAARGVSQRLKEYR